MNSGWNVPEKDELQNADVRQAYESPKLPEPADIQSPVPLFGLEKRYGLLYLVMLAAWLLSDVRLHDLLAGRGIAISDPGAGALALRSISLAAVYAVETTAAWLLVPLVVSPEKRGQLQFGHWYVLSAALTHALPTLLMRCLSWLSAAPKTWEEFAALASRPQAVRMIGLALSAALFVWAWARIRTVQRWSLLLITLPLSHALQVVTIGLLLTQDHTRVRNQFDLWGPRLSNTSGMLNAISTLAVFGYAVEALVQGRRLDWLCWLGVMHPLAMIALERMAPGWR
jgi:hypothetical protein